MTDIKGIVALQHSYFQTNATKDINFRLKNLERLYQGIKAYEERILIALRKDLNKSSFEGYMTEIGMVFNEISYFKKNLKKLAKANHVKTPLAQAIGSSKVTYEPYGVVGILAPWNYPFQLSIAPLVGAIAAGNCAIIKPSPDAIHTSYVINQLISEYFPNKYIAVIEGGIEESNQLLEEKLDYIFYTGSTYVGKLIMEKAAKHLTPVTLELGGKSPCIIDKTANLKLAAKRIVFGKFLNAGQTCVAPDYIYVHKDKKEELIGYLTFYLKKFYGEDALNNKDYVRIINRKHYDRLLSLIEGETIVIGGKGNEDLQIQPTILDNITTESRIMEEEIFGPILPILTYEHLTDVVNYIKGGDKPLALYLFTQDKKVERYILNTVSFGGGCINDTIVHLATHHMGFGGVGASGMGAYHGKDSFLTFSHKKSIMKKSNLIDIPMRYAPYTSKKLRLIKRFLK